MRRRWMLVAALFLGALGCDAEAPCASHAECDGVDDRCINGECRSPRSCDDVSCGASEVCVRGFCMPDDVDAGSPADDGGVDGGPRGDGGVAEDGAVSEDAGLVGLDGGDGGGNDGGLDGGGSGARDAGPIPVDAGTDGGPDAGPPCTCSPGQITRVLNCGVCGRRIERCRADCRSVLLEACLDADLRCPTNDAPYCRNDFCWGGALVHETGSSNQCIDMGNDYIPSDGNGSGGFGTLDLEIVGRPGASWVRENRHTSCGTGQPWVAAEMGTIQANGRDNHTPFVYGASPCDLSTLGRFHSRIQIDDPGGPAFTLPNTVVRLYNSTCEADRDSCGDATTFCPGS